MCLHQTMVMVSLMSGAGLATALTATKAPDTTVSWAFAHPPPQTPGAAAPPLRRSLKVPGSHQQYDQDQIDDMFGAVDWFPSRHPPPPRPVLMGRRPDAMACGYCHLPDGQGRPENAALAGLPARYIAEQVWGMRTGARLGAQPDWIATKIMTRVAKGVRKEEVAEAARYYAKLKYKKAFRLLEVRDIPAVAPTFGAYSYQPKGPPQSLGARIIEVPNDADRMELRDNRPGYTIYIPLGATARGQRLAETGADGRFAACASCHGGGLTGALGPPLAGRYPAYLFRQLLSFSVGGRTGSQSAAMTLVAQKMTTEEMIDLAAYAASLEP